MYSIAGCQKQFSHNQKKNNNNIIFIGTSKKQEKQQQAPANNNSKNIYKKEIYEISRVLLIIHTNTTVPVFAGV